MPSLFHDYDMVSCGGKTNGAEVDERVWSQPTVFSVFSAMLGDLTEDPSAWRDVKRKLNGMLGKVDMNPVLIDAFALAYSQVEIARSEALETERVDKLVEGACKDAFEALRQRRKEKEPPEAVVEEEPVSQRRKEKEPPEAVVEEEPEKAAGERTKAKVTTHIVWSKVKKPYGGKGAGLILDSITHRPRPCHCYHGNPRRPCTAGIPMGDSSGLGGLCAYGH